MVNPSYPETTPAPTHSRALLVEAFLWMGLARLAVRALPFRRVMGFCGISQMETPTALDPASAVERDRVASAIDAVRLFTPWDSNCLAQALAGSRMLRRRGIASTLYLGVAKNDKQALVAHAWLRSRERIVAGERGHDSYVVVGWFGCNPEERQ